MFLAGTGFFAGGDFFAGSDFLCKALPALSPPASSHDWLFFAACLAAGAGFAAGRRTTLDGTAFDGSDLSGSRLDRRLHGQSFFCRSLALSGR